MSKVEDVFVCKSLTSKKNPCRSITHVMEYVDYKASPTINRCDYCHSHCPHQDQFHEARKTMQALFTIMFGIKGAKQLFSSIWFMRPAAQFAHVDYSDLIEVADALAQQLLKLEENDGATMERDDLSHDEWLEHLQHELMDAIVYVQRLRTREQTLEVKLRELMVAWRSSVRGRGVLNAIEALLDEVSE